MSEELQKPPVLDFDVLLAPISEESPSGENMRYSGLYDEINEARRADDPISQGEWQSNLKVADHRKVIELAVDALSTKTKDLQVASWLSDSLINEYGWVGFRDALKLMSGLQEYYWDTLHPEIDEGDMEGRANAVSWIDTQCALTIKRTPIIQGYGYLDWEDAKKFDFPESIEHLDTEEAAKIQDLMDQAKRENRTTADVFKRARAQTRRQFVEEVNFAIEECKAELKELDRVDEEKYDRNQTPGLGTVNKVLDTVHEQVKKILADKRAEEPTDEELAALEGGGDGEAYEGGGGGGSRSGGVSGRADALKRLGEIAAYFQRTEPHSPVAYLVQRAVKWGNMPLDTWLQDVIKDENVLGHLRETLGMGSSSSSGYESSDYGSTDYDSSDSYAETTTETTSTDDW